MVAYWYNAGSGGNDVIISLKQCVTTDLIYCVAFDGMALLLK